VRKLLGWQRYDTREQLRAINDLYRGDWRTMMNLFQPCVKLKEKVRVGSRLIRRYDQAQTPLDRLVAHYGNKRLPAAVRGAIAVREQTDPFALSASIDRQLARLTTSAPHKERRNQSVLEQRTPSPRGGGHRPQTTPADTYAW
jgi:hypothetical protein